MNDRQGKGPQPGCDRLLAQTLRRLLRGEAPAACVEGPHAAYGEWGEVLAALVEAHGRGGTKGLEEAYLVLARLNPRLTALMAGDPEPPRTVWTLGELLRASFPPPEFIVPGLLPVGMTDMAGRPKIGKSWLANQLAVAVDSGGEVLGQKVPRAKVLYLALEDSPGRLADRLRKLTAAPTWQGAAGSLGRDAGGSGGEVCRVGESLFAVAWPRLQEGGLERIAAALREGHRLVVIDTFSRACGRADQMDAGEMTMLLGDLQRLALDHHAAIMLVDHHRKSARTSPDTDPIDDIYGSTAKAGVVDCAIGLYRRHNEETATLKLSGRDFGDRELPLRWDAGACRWEALPPEETQRTTLGRGYQAVLDALGALGEASGLQVAQYLEMDRDNTYHRLKELHARGVVARELREGKLVYRLAEQDAPVGAVEAVEAVGAVGEEVG